MSKSINQIHTGVGDNVGGNKNISDNKVEAETRAIPVWLQYVVAVATLLGVVWGVYISFNSN